MVTSPLRRIATAAVLCAAALPSAASAATVSLSPASAPPGTPVKITGSGFGAGEAVDVLLDHDAVQVTVTSANGSFAANLPVPGDVRPGGHEVAAIGRGSAAAGSRKLTISTPWAQGAFDARKQAYNPYENQLTSDSVSRLDVAWTTPSGPALGAPAVAGGKVFAGTGDGHVVAYPAACGTAASTCAPTWIGQAGGSFASSPAVAGNFVYAASSDGSLYAFKTACATGGKTCNPVWKGTTGGAITGAPVISGKSIYVASADHTLSAFPLSCAAACTPSWQVALDDGATSSPAIADGRIYVGSQSGTVYAFPLSKCAAGSCDPIWTGHTGAAIRGNLAIAGGFVYASGPAKTAAFPLSCAGDCTPTWTSAGGASLLTGITTAFSSVYASPPLSRVGQTCATGGASCAMTKLHSGSSGFSAAAPTVAADVLYSVDTDGTLGAYAPDCTPRPGTTECTPLWSTTTGTGRSFSSTPVVSDGTLYASTSDGRLYAFTLAGLRAGTTL